jgi:hypothetical protein
MFIFGSSLLVLRCATALKSSLEVTSSWMSLAGYPANNVAFPGRMDPGRPRRATRGQPGKRDPGSRSHEFRTVDPGSPAASPRLRPGKLVGMGHYCQLRVMAMSPGIPSGQSTIWTRSL